MIVKAGIYTLNVTKTEMARVVDQQFGKVALNISTVEDTTINFNIPPFITWGVVNGTWGGSPALWGAAA